MHAPAEALPVACRVCGGRQGRFLCRNVNEHSATQWLDSYRCATCGSVFIGNAISDAELAEAYASIDEAAYYRETAAASAPKFAQAARHIAGLAPRAAAVLDLGGGHGAFVRALKTEGLTRLAIHEIPGADVPDMAAAGIAVHRDTDYASLPTDAFDVVTMMDVLEHVPRVDETLTAVRRILRPGGILYAHTPVVTVLDRIMHGVQKLPFIGGVGRAWQRTRTTVFHLQNYTPKALRDLAGRNGFTVEALDIINELSWPVARYVRVYLVERGALPAALAPLAAVLLTPVLRSRLHANKAVLVARAAL